MTKICKFCKIDLNDDNKAPNYCRCNSCHKIKEAERHKKYNELHKEERKITGKPTKK